MFTRGFCVFSFKIQRAELLHFFWNYICCNRNYALGADAQKRNGKFIISGIYVYFITANRKSSFCLNNIAGSFLDCADKRIFCKFCVCFRFYVHSGTGRYVIYDGRKLAVFCNKRIVFQKAVFIGFVIIWSDGKNRVCAGVSCVKGKLCGMACVVASGSGNKRNTVIYHIFCTADYIILFFVRKCGGFSGSAVHNYRINAFLNKFINKIGIFFQINGTVFSHWSSNGGSASDK